MSIEFEYEDYTVKVKEEAKEIAYEKLIEFCKKHTCWSGESAAQCDGPQTEGIWCLVDIIDSMFEVTYHDDE